MNRYIQMVFSDMILYLPCSCCSMSSSHIGQEGPLHRFILCSLSLTDGHIITRLLWFVLHGPALENYPEAIAVSECSSPSSSGHFSLCPWVAAKQVAWVATWFLRCNSTCLLLLKPFMAQGVFICVASISISAWHIQVKMMHSRFPQPLSSYGTKEVCFLCHCSCPLE